MDYKQFKKARKLGRDEGNKSLLGRIDDCEDMLGVLDWLKSNENVDEAGKPRFKATITVNIHGRSKEDSNEKGVRSISYDTNFDYVENKVRSEYDRLVREFEANTGD